MRTRDGGRTWTGIPAPKAPLSRYPDGTNAVAQLRFADPSDGWASGGALWSTHDGGAHWAQQHVGPSGTAVFSLESGGGYVYAKVQDCGSNGCSERVYASPVGHDAWKVVSGTAPVGTGNLVVHGSDWFLPSATTYFHGTGSGTATTIGSPCAQDFGLTLALADAQHLDAVCAGDGAGGHQAYQLYGTTDGGAHWTRAGGQHIEESGIDGAADNAQGVLMLALAAGDSELLRTTDDGGHFAKVLTVSTGGISWRDLGFTTSTQGVAVVATRSLYLTHDAGATWSKVAFG